MADDRLLQARGMVAAFLLGVPLPGPCNGPFTSDLAVWLVAIAQRRGLRL